MGPADAIRIPSGSKGQLRTRSRTPGADDRHRGVAGPIAEACEEAGSGFCQGAREVPRALRLRKNGPEPVSRVSRLWNLTEFENKGQTLSGPQEARFDASSRGRSFILER